MSKRSPPAAEHKAWFKYLRGRTGESAKVLTFYDEPRENSIDMFSARMGNTHVASTIGLMEIDQSRKPGVEIRTEVLMERDGSEELLANVLSTIAFFSMKDRWKIAPDVIFETLVSMYDPRTTLPHVMFVPIFRWDDMSRVQVLDRTIYPLLAIPISDAESALATTHGAQALTDRFVARATDVNDWRRASVA